MRHILQIAIMLGCCLTAVATEPPLPRVLIIGDSISSGYTGTVKKVLDGTATVIRSPGNASATAKGLAKPRLPKHWVDPEASDDPENPDNQSDKRKRKWQTDAAGVVPKPTDYATNLDYYLAHGPFEIIHFNWGLHDLKRGGIPLDDYFNNLTQLVDVMAATGATLIFATTTPVPEKNSERRIPAMVEEFNQAAVAMLRQRGVIINDLFTAVLPHLGEYQLPNNVHFTKEGYHFLGQHVASAIRQALAATPEP